MSSKIEEIIKNSRVVIYSDDIAVALKYESEIDSAPVLIYKSKHIKKTKELAKKLYVPTYKCPIATSIAKDVKINSSISPVTYHTVAIIIANLIKKQEILSSKKVYAILISKETEMRIFSKVIRKKVLKGGNVSIPVVIEFQKFFSKLSNTYIKTNKEPLVIVCSNRIRNGIQFLCDLTFIKTSVFSHNEITIDSKIIVVETI